MSNALMTFFGMSTNSTPQDELPNIFPLDITKEDFIKTDVFSIFSKILTDTSERTHGIDDKYKDLLFDNCLQNESKKGLITFIAEAMAGKEDLFLVFKLDLMVLRKATSEEIEIIKKDYEAKGKSPIGLFISFKNYKKTDMVKLYSALEYFTVDALNKSLNLSKAVQIKLANLRGDISLTDSEVAKAQAVAIAQGLKKGRDVMLDSGDTIETAMPKLEAVEKAMDFIAMKQSFYLGLPKSYVLGILNGGLGDSGEGDSKAIERGLKNYFFSIIKPVFETVFETKITYKTQDFRHITSGLEVLRTFDLISDEYVTRDQKIEIVENMLDLEHQERPEVEEVDEELEEEEILGE